MRIGVDLMGGETSPHVFFQAVQEICVEVDQDLEFVVFATSDVLDQLPVTDKISMTPVDEVITHEDDPLVAVRKKKDSSLFQGVRWLSEEKLDAFVSAGNTGALIATSKVLLDLLPGITRPALLATLPTATGCLSVVDIGGNVTSKKEHYIQYAYLGASYQKYHHGIDHPKVGLLNIGGESTKGLPHHREVYEELFSHSNSLFTFVGNIEAKDVFGGKIDVLVTDGFSGNVFLKSAEGIASFIFQQVKELICHSSELRELEKIFHYAEYPGAIVSGVNALVVKCHGYSSKQAFKAAILGAYKNLNNKSL